MINHTIEALIKFIEKAERLGKYPRNTSQGYMAAIRLAIKGLTEDEPRTIEYLKGNAVELFSRQHDLPLSPQSIPVYIARVRKVCSDYQQYGVDATKIYSWNRSKRERRNTKRPKEEPIATNNTDNDPSSLNTSFGGARTAVETKLYVVQWSLRSDLVVRLELPVDLNSYDVDKLKDSLDLELKHIQRGKKSE